MDLDWTPDWSWLTDWAWIPGIELTRAETTFVEVVGIIATVLVAFLAAGAIVHSGRQGRKALKAIARERRLDFELGVLKELSNGYS